MQLYNQASHEHQHRAYCSHHHRHQRSIHRRPYAQQGHRAKRAAHALSQWRESTHRVQRLPTLLHSALHLSLQAFPLVRFESECATYSNSLCSQLHSDSTPMSAHHAHRRSSASARPGSTPYRLGRANSVETRSSQTRVLALGPGCGSLATGHGCREVYNKQYRRPMTKKPSANL